MDLAHLVAYQTKYFAKMNLTGNPYLIPFDVNRGVLNSVSRFLLGVALVVTWKTLAKPIVLPFYLLSTKLLVCIYQEEAIFQLLIHRHQLEKLDQRQCPMTQIWELVI